ncbi:MAG: hypothetical protein ACI8RO_002363, partial [Flavobacteriales bacterium]
MNNKLRYLRAFIISVLAASIIASMFSTQFVVAGLRELGLEIPTTMRLAMTFGDLASLKSLGIIISLCFLIGFIIVAVAKRYLRGSRLSWYTVAGGLSYTATLLLIEQFLQLMPIAGARTIAGMFTQGLAGAEGLFLHNLPSPSETNPSKRSMKMFNSKIALLALSALLLFGIAKAHAESPSYQVDTLLSGIDSPWSLAFLPNGDMLITELGGKLRRVQDGQLDDQAIEGLPEVYFEGQGGLMDVIIDHDFERNQRLYLSFSYGDSSGNATRLVSAKLDGNRLLDLQVLFTASPLKRTPHHYSGRVVQLQDSSLLLTVGDGFNYREQAQKLDNHLGKIIRILPNGEVPEDNPWVNDPEAQPEIWSMGHRNMQAIV